MWIENEICCRDKAPPLDDDDTCLYKCKHAIVIPKNFIYSCKHKLRVLFSPWCGIRQMSNDTHSREISTNSNRMRTII